MKTLRFVVAAAVVLAFATLVDAAGVRRTVNYDDPQLWQIDVPPGFDDENHWVWDGNGNPEACFGFDVPGELVLGAPQLIRIRVRKNAPGGNNTYFGAFMTENLKQISGDWLHGHDYADANWVTLEFTWYADDLKDPFGKDLLLAFVQTDGGGGKPDFRRAMEISAVEWVATVYDPEGNPTIAFLYPNSF